jgi:predicted NBD/HSP70 family sugar kinase
VDLALPLPRGEDRELLRRYLVARLHNLLTVCSPSRIELVGPSDVRGLLRECCRRLRAAPRSHGVVLGIVARLCGAPVELEVVPGEVLSGAASVSGPDPGSGIPGLPAGETGATAVGGLLVGVDLGGTDIKLALADERGLCFLLEHVWDPQPRAFVRAEQFPEAIAALVIFALVVRQLEAECADTSLAVEARRLAEDRHASLEERIRLSEKALDRGLLPPAPAAVGVSFPDVVAADRVVGGMTSKYAAIRARYQDGEGGWRDEEGYWREFGEQIGFLGVRIGERLARLWGVQPPVRITNDGTAGALWAARRLGRGGVLALSLGTSLAGGLVDAHGHPYPGMCELGNMIVFIGDDGYAGLRHRTLRLPGVAQQVLSQDAVFALAREEGLLVGDPRGEEARVLRRLWTETARERPAAVARIQEALGRALCLVLATTSLALPDQELGEVVLFGRVVRGAAGEAIIEAARRLLPEDPAFASVRGVRLRLAREIAAPGEARAGGDPEALAQAIGALFLAGWGDLAGGAGA